MKQVIRVFIFLAILATAIINPYISYAQSPESITISSRVVEQNQQTQVEVVIAATSATPIQGISFLIKYDPDCLRPSGMRSLVLNLNNTSMPQSESAVEGIFTSTDPLPANGNMVMVTFIPAAACQTELALEKAQLIVLNNEGLAQPLIGVSVDKSPVPVSISQEQVSAEPQATENLSVIADITPSPEKGAQTALPTVEGKKTGSNPLTSLVFIGAGILLLFAGILTALIIVLVRQKRQPTEKSAIDPISPPANSGGDPEHYLVIRRGIQAGTRRKVENFPFSLGYSPANDMPLEDPSISAFHAKLFLKDGKVILVDLGHPIGTGINGNTIHNQRLELKDGDVIKIGAILLIYSRL